MTTGSAVAPFIQSREDAGEAWFFGGRTSIRSSAETTDGALGIVEQIMDPGLGSPWHVHHNEDEEFYLIDGQVRFYCADQQWIVGPGAFVFLPRGIPHGFEVIGDTPAHFLLMATPGGFEGFVRELSEPQPGAPDMAKVMETAGRYGLEILGPLPAANPA